MRYTLALGAVSLIAVLSACSSMSVMTPSPRQVKEMVSRAASLDAKAFETMAKVASTPPLEMAENQSLTLILSGLPSEPGSPLAKDFRYAGAPNPAKLAQAIMPEGAEYASFIQPDYIVKVETNDSGKKDETRLTGKLSVQVKDLYELDVCYILEKASEGWKVVELSLPASGIKTVLGENGKWQAEGLPTPEGPTP